MLRYKVLYCHLVKSQNTELMVISPPPYCSWEVSNASDVSMCLLFHFMWQYLYNTGVTGSPAIIISTGVFHQVRQGNILGASYIAIDVSIEHS